MAEENPDALARPLSRFEQDQTALHYVIAPPDGVDLHDTFYGEREVTIVDPNTS